jgi:uncharacterized protein (TIGR02246 family)
MLLRRWLMLATVIGVSGYATVASGQPADVAKLREELMVLEKASWDFMRDRNLAGMRSYLTDDGLLIFADGTRFDKQGMMTLMPEFRLDSISFEPDYSVRIISPDVAILLYRVTYTSAVKGGKAETFRVLSSNVYVRRDNKWSSLHYQETPVK